MIKNPKEEFTDIISTAHKSDLRSEARGTLQLADPLIVAQICATSIGALNVVMMSLLGTKTLATAGLGAFTFLNVGLHLVNQNTKILS